MSDKQPDRNFDDLSNRFNRTIYQTLRGQLRLKALECDFVDYQLIKPNTQLLDLGGGQGQFSLWCAQQGANITLYDISQSMLNQAIECFDHAGLPIQTRITSLQDAHSVDNKQYDVVCNHAVLEWLEEPFQALPHLMNFVKPNGYLSLMFYNESGHHWRQLMNGRTHAPHGANQRLRQEGNAPQHPLNVLEVIQALENSGMQCLRWRGIRCIHDHMHQKIRDRIGQEAVIQSDLEIGLQEPFKHLGRYVHVLLKKTINET